MKDREIRVKLTVEGVVTETYYEAEMKDDLSPEKMDEQIAEIKKDPGVLSLKYTRDISMERSEKDI